MPDQPSGIPGEFERPHRAVMAAWHSMRLALTSEDSRDRHALRLAEYCEELHRRAETAEREREELRGRLAVLEKHRRFILGAIGFSISEREYPDNAREAEKCALAEVTAALVSDAERGTGG